VAFLMAGPEKALCDRVLLTRHLQAISRPSMRDFLFQDMRLDEEMLAQFDLSIVQRYAECGHKPRQMQALFKVLEALQ